MTTPETPKFGTWYDIATAPRDGEVRLLRMPKPINIDEELWHHTIGFQDLKSSGEFWKDQYGSIIRPTHWTPLPEPPDD